MKPRKGSPVPATGRRVVKQQTAIVSPFTEIEGKLLQIEERLARVTAGEPARGGRVRARVGAIPPRQRRARQSVARSPARVPAAPEAKRSGLPEALLASYADLARELRPRSMRVLLRSLLPQGTTPAVTDREVGDALLPLVRMIGRTWWRVRWDGGHEIGVTGGALVVTTARDPAAPFEAAAILASLSERVADASRIRTALEPERLEARPLGGWLRGLGAVAARHAEVLRLLRTGDVVVLPLASERLAATTATTVSEIERWVAVAQRAGVPLHVARVSGVARSHPGGRALRGWLDGLGAVGVPASLPAMALGLAGLAGLPGRWRVDVAGPFAGPSGRGRERRDLARRVAEALQG